jgi:hypothetical protein
MKKIHFTILLLFLIFSSFSQNIDSTLKSDNFNKFNFSINCGYSDISGFLGAGINKKKFGIDFGWKKKILTLNNFTESKNVFGFGLSYYLLNFAKKGFPYFSIGYSINGSCESFKNEIFWGDKMIFIIGYEICSYDIPLSIKMGVGYQISSYESPFAMEIKFIIKIFDL